MNNLYEIFNRLINDLQYANEESIIKTYDAIAELILHRGHIKVNQKQFLIREVEFYYFSKNKHEDIFTHGFHNIDAKERQLTFAQWYFHPNLSGVDLTIGNNENFGGILIRGINHDDKLIDGPFNILKTILESFSNNIFSDNSISIFFDDEHIQRKKIIVSTKRIGLSNKIETERNAEFINKPYRYLSLEPNLKNNTKNNKYEVVLDFKEQYKELDPNSYFSLDKSTMDNYKKK
jgi:hypothetical protein